MTAPSFSDTLFSSLSDTPVGETAGRPIDRHPGSRRPHQSRGEAVRGTAGNGNSSGSLSADQWQLIEFDMLNTPLHALELPKNPPHNQAITSYLSTSSSDGAAMLEDNFPIDFAKVDSCPVCATNRLPEKLPYMPATIRTLSASASAADSPGDNQGLVDSEPMTIASTEASEAIDIPKPAWQPRDTPHVNPMPAATELPVATSSDASAAANLIQGPQSSLAPAPVTPPADTADTVAQPQGMPSASEALQHADIGVIAQNVAAMNDQEQLGAGAAGPSAVPTLTDDDDDEDYRIAMSVLDNF